MFNYKSNNGNTSQNIWDQMALFKQIKLLNNLNKMTWGTAISKLL